MRSATRPLSAYQVLGQIAGSRIKAPTQVYRALEGLLSAKLIHRVETLNAYLCCDRAPHNHDIAFAICDTCGSVKEIPLKPVESALKGSIAAQGFAMRE